MSARADYIAGADSYDPMCDEIDRLNRVIMARYESIDRYTAEIDRLRAQVERDRPVIQAADIWFDHFESGQLRDAVRARRAACAPDEINVRIQRWEHRQGIPVTGPRFYDLPVGETPPQGVEHYMPVAPSTDDAEDSGKTHYYGDACDPPHVDPCAPDEANEEQE